MIYYVIFPILIIILNFFIKKKGLFFPIHQYEHQKFANVKLPLIGGFYLIVPITIIFYESYFFFSVICLLIFILGTLSDLKILSSPKKRFFIQFLLIVYYIFFNKIEVLPSRIEFIDSNFLNTNLSFIFTVFCLMILINGSNFIDGMNGLLTGYLLIILFIFYHLRLNEFLNINEEDFILIAYFFLIVLIFNIFNQFFLGDSGAYSMSFFIGYLLIEVYNQNLRISPYFIILLLWYPCFENLFSIIRKIIKKKSALKPDNEHLHQFIFLYLKKKLRIQNLYANLLTALIINLINFIILYYGSTEPLNTMLQLELLFLSIFIYVLSYLILKKFLKFSNS